MKFLEAGAVRCYLMHKKTLHGLNIVCILCTLDFMVYFGTVHITAKIRKDKTSTFPGHSCRKRCQMKI